MIRLVTSLFVLTCAVQTTLCQTGDCSTEEGRLAYWTAGVDRNPDCYNPVVRLTVNMEFPTAADISAICQDDCAEEIAKFLEGCPNDDTASYFLSYLKDTLCAFKDGEKPDGSCSLQDQTNIEKPLTSCFGWFLFPNARDDCPALVPDTPDGTASCTDTLKSATEEYGCCFQNLFGTEQFIDTTTADSISNLEAANLTIPDDFEVDITDPLLFAACGVSLPDMCKSAIDSAPGLIATPLMALLLAFVAKLVAF